MRFSPTGKVFDFTFPNHTPGAACQAGRHWLLFLKAQPGIEPESPSLKADTLPLGHLVSN